MSTPQATVSSADGDWPSPSVAWYTVGVLMVAYTLSFVDRTIIALLVEPIKADLGISDTQISILHGLAFAIFYTTLGVPIGRLADRYSRRWIMAIGIFLWSLATAACGLARSFMQLFAARVAVGVGEAALSPAAFSLIADSFPPERLGRALSVYSVGVYFGAGLAFIIGGAVIQFAAASSVSVPLVGDVAGWQMVFFYVGLPGVLVALWVLSLREPARRNRQTEGSDLPSIREVLAYLRSGMGAYGSHFLGFALLAMVFNVVVGWAPSFLVRTFGFSQGQAGLSLGLIILVFGSAGLVAGGWFADWLAARGHRDATIRAGVVSGFAMTPFVIAAPLVSDPTFALVLFCPLLFFSSFGFGAAAAALQLITPNEMRGQVSAVYLFCINLIGIGVGPLLTALATDYLFADAAAVRYSIALVAGLAAPLGGVILCLGLHPFRERAKAFAG